MKKVLIGGFISLIGSIMMMAFSISATSMMETGWSTPPGKFLSAIAAANVSFGFWVSIMLIVLGGVILVFEFSRKNNKSQLFHQFHTLKNVFPHVFFLHKEVYHT